MLDETFVDPWEFDIKEVGVDAEDIIINEVLVGKKKKLRLLK